MGNASLNAAQAQCVGALGAYMYPATAIRRERATSPRARGRFPTAQALVLLIENMLRGQNMPSVLASVASASLIIVGVGTKLWELARWRVLFQSFA